MLLKGLIESEEHLLDLEVEVLLAAVFGFVEDIVAIGPEDQGRVVAACMKVGSAAVVVVVAVAQPVEVD